MIKRIDITPDGLGCYWVIVNDDPEHADTQMATGHIDALAVASDIIQDEIERQDPGRFTPTERQREAYAFIELYIATHAQAPNLREIADGLGLQSKSNAHRLVVGLEARGWLQRQPGRARSYKLMGRARP